MAKTYTVLHDWSSDYEHGTNILGIFTDKNEAYDTFQNALVDEKNLAEEEGFTVETDTDVCFDAYEDGYYAKNHTTLTIEELITDIKLTDDVLQKAKQCLRDNGIEENKCATVLQAICYILLDVEIYDEQGECV